MTKNTRRFSFYNGYNRKNDVRRCERIFKRRSNTINMNCTDNWTFYVSKAASFVQGGVPDAEISRGRKILPDPHLFYFLSINFPPAFFFYINCHECTGFFKERTASILQYFSHNCSIFYRCHEKQTQQFLLASFFSDMAPVLSTTE